MNIKEQLEKKYNLIIIHFGLDNGVHISFGLHLYRESRFSEALSQLEVESWNEKLKELLENFHGNDSGNSFKNSTVTLSAIQ